MNIKKTIELLKQCNLNETERKSFAVCLQLLEAKYICVKKVGISGLKELLATHSFVVGIKNLLSNSMEINEKSITIYRQ